jgi:hypothetical protein
MTLGSAPRLLLAGACFLVVSLTAPPVAFPQSRATAPDATRKAQSKSKSKRPPARRVPVRQPAWGSMPAAKPMALEKLPQPTLSPRDATARHYAGLKAERAGDDQAAFQAFREAAEAGHAASQLKLGEIYDRGNSVVDRDYAAALGWYQKAREQGMTVPKPHTFPARR